MEPVRKEASSILFYPTTSFKPSSELVIGQYGLTGEKESVSAEETTTDVIQTEEVPTGHHSSNASSDEEVEIIFEETLDSHQDDQPEIQ